LKLVFLGPTYPLRGGIARYGTQFLAALQKRHECLGIGFSKLYPAFLFPGHSELDPAEMPAVMPQTVKLLHYAKWLTWIRALRMIREFNPDGVLLTWWVTFWAPHLGWLARRLKVSHPTIFLCHNVLPHETRFFDPRLTRWALKPARGFIVHSEQNRRQLLNWFPQARVLRREHPIYAFNANPSLGRNEARKELGVNGRMLLFCGFVRPYKGLDVAIEALAHLGTEYGDLVLWICGEFWEDEERYDDLIGNLKLQHRVRIESGYLPDEQLAIRIAACDGVILPYRSATGSGILANAYALDRPVIATRTGCFREMVIPGETGVLCEPGDARSLAQAIREFYSGAGPDRFQEGLARAKIAFSWDGIISAVEELLHLG